MKIYISSIGFGKQFEELRKTLPKNPRMAYIINAKDHENFSIWDARNLQKLLEFEKIGFQADILDLKKYFGKKDILQNELMKYDFIWVRGGNVFVLSRAMKFSGFSEALRGRAQLRRPIVYGGWSAGACILYKTLTGADIVDDPKINPYNMETADVFEGIGIINEAIVPHFESDDMETSGIGSYITYLKQNNIPHMVLRDGEDIILDYDVKSMG